MRKEEEQFGDVAITWYELRHERNVGSLQAEQYSIGASWHRVDPKGIQEYD